MASTFSHVASLMAGLAICATGLIVFPNTGLKGLSKGLVITISLSGVAALLITAARQFG